MADWPTFRLTSYRHPLNQLINDAIDQLLQRISVSDKADRKYHYYNGELIVRDTA